MAWDTVWDTLGNGSKSLWDTWDTFWDTSKSVPLLFGDTWDTIWDGSFFLFSSKILCTWLLEMPMFLAIALTEYSAFFSRNTFSTWVSLLIIE